MSSAAVDRALLAVDRMERRDDSDATMLTDVGVLVWPAYLVQAGYVGGVHV